MLKVVKSQPESNPPSNGHGRPTDELTEGFLVDSRYQILRRASRWTVGDTYLAHDLQFNETVVLVTPDCPPGQAATFLQAMRVDAERTQPLHRGPVVTIRDTGLLPSGRPFFALRHVPGTSLWRHIKSEGPLPTEVALRLFEALAHRIKQAHDIGVYLGDIRPANILLVETPDGVAPEIIDLGYARGLFDGVLSLPAPSPAYRSPQQRRRLPLSASDDIYALGAVLYFMLTARPPRAGNTEDPSIMVGADMGEVVTPPSNVRTDLDFPMYVDQVVLTALAVRPEERFRTVTDVLRGVEGLMELFSLSPKARAMLYNEGQEDETTMDVDPSAADLGVGPEQIFSGPAAPRPSSQGPATAVYQRLPPQPGPSQGPSMAQHSVPQQSVPQQGAAQRPGSGTRPFDARQLSGNFGASGSEQVFQSLNAAWDQGDSGQHQSPGREEVWSSGAMSADPPTRPLHPAQLNSIAHGVASPMAHPSGIQPMTPRLPQPPAAQPPPAAQIPPPTAEPPAHDPAAAPVLPSLQQMGIGAIPATEQDIDAPPPGGARPAAEEAETRALVPVRGSSASERLPNREERINQASKDPFRLDPLQLESEPVAPSAMPSPSRQPERRQRVAMGLVAVAVLAAASLGGFLVMKKTRDKSQFLPPPEARSQLANDPTAAPLADPGAVASNPTAAPKETASALAAMAPLDTEIPAEDPAKAVAEAVAPSDPVPSRTVKLEVITEPAGAEVVSVDTSELICKSTPCDFERPREAAGTLVVRVERDAYVSIVRPLPLDKDNSFKLVLDPAAPETPEVANNEKAASPSPSKRSARRGQRSAPKAPTPKATAKAPTPKAATPKPVADPFGDDPFGSDPFATASSAPKAATPKPAAPKAAKKPATPKPAGGDLFADPFGDDPFVDSAPKAAKKPAKPAAPVAAPKPATPKPAAAPKPAGGDLFADPFADDPFADAPVKKKESVKKPAKKKEAAKKPVAKPASPKAATPVAPPPGEDLFANPFE